MLDKPHLLQLNEGCLSDSLKISIRPRQA